MPSNWIANDVAAWVFDALQWAVCIGAILIVPSRRSSEAAKGWLLLFFIAPLPAWVLYIFIGRARHPRWRRERARRLPDIIRRAVGQAGASLREATADLPPRFASISGLAQAIGRLPPLVSSGAELEPRYNRMIDRLAADIDAAEHHAHLMFYIFEDDDAGDRILSALERASERGVACRLLIDAFGSSGSRRTISKRLKHSKVDLHLILPFRFGSGATRADMRNHRKIAVIDGCVGWVGSQNIVNADGEADVPNRELMARVTGPAVAELQIVFIGDWYLETATELRSPDLFPEPKIVEQGGLLQVVPSGPDNPAGRIDMLFAAMILAANRRVVLTTPYFIPSEHLFFAMRSAALRGLDVVLIVSCRTDSRFIDLAQRSYFGELLDGGVKVFLCETNFLHAKHVSVDEDLALIGSSNMDMRSFELNSEVSLVAYDQNVVRDLKVIETQYVEGSRQLVPEEWHGRPLYNKVAANIARLVSPLL